MNTRSITIAYYIIFNIEYNSCIEYSRSQTSKFPLVNYLSSFPYPHFQTRFVFLVEGFDESLLLLSHLTREYINDTDVPNANVTQQSCLYYPV